MHGIRAAQLAGLTARVAAACAALESLADDDPVRADERLPEARACAAELLELLREGARARLPEEAVAPLRDAAEVLLPLIDGEDPAPGGLPERADAALAPAAQALHRLRGLAGG
ncbi:hypothetical protein [Phaeacidiphilus oryzae]|jgi:hypothetical protein|uniref:hypothetical protein n=1 Tax=Phaeacidiphilus oryzae TaxID=348818 RepID=UPI000565D675|nr:hypothetical protein [Phaeacidiphilus oryzae]